MNGSGWKMVMKECAEATFASQLGAQVKTELNVKKNLATLTNRRLCWLVSRFSLRLNCLNNYWMVFMDDIWHNIHGPQRMFPSTFSDLLTHLSSSGQNFTLSNTLVYDRISAKLKTLPYSVFSAVQSNRLDFNIVGESALCWTRCC